MRKQPAHVLSVAILIAGSALTSCASSSISQGPAQVDDLVSWIERVYVESELARERANAAVTQLEAILAAEGGVKDATEALDLYQQRQKIGVGIPLDAIVAAEILTDARLDYLDAVIGFNKAQLKLLRSLGRQPE